LAFEYVTTRSSGEMVKCGRFECVLLKEATLITFSPTAGAADP
jgi:hypothetical protein